MPPISIWLCSSRLDRNERKTSLLCRGIWGLIGLQAMVNQSRSYHQNNIRFRLYRRRRGYQGISPWNLDFSDWRERPGGAEPVKSRDQEPWLCLHRPRSPFSNLPFFTLHEKNRTHNQPPLLHVLCINRLVGHIGVREESFRRIKASIARSSLRIGWH